MGEAGNYYKKPIAVDARQLPKGGVVTLANGQGILHAQVNDWLLTDPDGKQWVVANSIFKNTYESLNVMKLQRDETHE